MPKTVNQTKINDIMKRDLVIWVFLETHSAILLITWYTYYNIYAKKIINSIWFLRLRLFYFDKNKSLNAGWIAHRKNAFVQVLLLIILLNIRSYKLLNGKEWREEYEHWWWGGGCCGMRKRRNGWIGGWHQCYNSVWIRS